MQDRIKKVLRRYQLRFDTEHEQVLIRLLFAVAILVFLWIDHSRLPIRDRAGSLALASAYVAIAAVGLLLLYCKPHPSQARRVGWIVLDSANLAAMYYFAGKAAIPLLFLSTWMPVDNGFRYGRRYMAGALLASTTILIGAIILEPYWTGHPLLAMGVVVNLLIVVGYTGFLLTKVHRTNARLKALATRDVLTGLPNRRFFAQHLQRATVLSNRAGRFCSCLFFDLDGFKAINELYGHAIGDLLLIEVSRRLLDNIRDTDVLSRFEGDKFAIAIQCQKMPNDAVKMAHRILRVLNGIETISGCEVQVSASIGIASYPNTTYALEHPDKLIEGAEAAMYAAKLEGKNCAHVSDDQGSDSEFDALDESARLQPESEPSGSHLVVAEDEPVPLFHHPIKPKGRVSLKQWVTLFFMSGGSQEHASSRNRLFICGAAFAWMLARLPLSPMQTVADFHAVIATGIYLSAALAIQYSIVADNMHHKVRYYTSLAFDPIATALVMIASGESSAPFIFAFSWIAVGQGFRFGLKSLLISSSFCLAAFLSLFYFSTYFRSASDFIEAIVLNFVALICYVAEVQRKLRNAKNTLVGMANYDRLTGLPNQRMFMDHLAVCMRASRRTLRYVACVFIDLDNFETVNDAYGYEVGDLLLQEVAGVLNRCCRGADLMARLSGDRFMIATECVADYTLALEIADRALKGIWGVTEIRGLPVNVSASIGVVFHRQSASKDIQPDPAALVAAAVAQMQEAKQAGKSCIRVGEPIN